MWQQVGYPSAMCPTFKLKRDIPHRCGLGTSSNLLSNQMYLSKLFNKKVLAKKLKSFDTTASKVWRSDAFGNQHSQKGIYAPYVALMLVLFKQVHQMAPPHRSPLQNPTWRLCPMCSNRLRYNIRVICMTTLCAVHVRCGKSIMQRDSLFELIHYTKKDIQRLIICNVVTILLCSTLIFNFLTINVRYKCVATFPVATSLSMMHGFHILTNTKFKLVTSTYYHS